jgi:hypothetical protein
MHNQFKIIKLSDNKRKLAIFKKYPDKNDDSSFDST